MKKQLFCLLAMVFVAFGCKKDKDIAPANPPSAEFSIFPLNSTYIDRAPFAVLAIANKVEGATYEWTTSGIETTSTGTNTEITFTVAGEHSITLKVTKDGKSSTIQKKIPLKKPFSGIKIKKVTLNNYPNKKSNGDFWDTFVTSPYHLPDIYYEITAPNGTVITEGATAVNASTPAIIWNYSSPFTIPFAYQATPLSLKFWDDDYPDNHTVSELMGNFPFTISDMITTTQSKRYPDTITGGSSINATIDIEWYE